MMHQYFSELVHNPMIVLTMMAIMLDTIFGLLRAIKERKFNSNFGIDGAIRKSGMVISVLFLMFADYVVHINLIGFLPQDMREAIHIDKIGMGEFFCLLYILYECVSILKNMYLCDLPISPKIKDKLERLLKDMTQEVKAEGK